MSLHLLVVAGIALVSALACQLVVTATRNYAAHKFFKKHSPSLPVLPNPNILLGHVNQVYWPLKNWRNLDDCHKLYGSTFGWYLIERPAISTTDLDLIKTMVIDEPNDHINRWDLKIPISEFSHDNIMLVGGEQWWRLRRAIAPAFTIHKIMSLSTQEEMQKIIARFMASIELKLQRAKTERDEDSISLDADDQFTRYAIALVFSCFYKQEDIVDFNSEEDHYVHLIEESAQNCVSLLLRMCNVFPVIIPIVEWLITKLSVQGHLISTLMGFIKQQTRLNLRAKKHIQQEIREGRKGSFDVNDFVLGDGTRFRTNMVDYIIDQFHAGKLNETEYMHNTFFLFLAATKTTGDALSRLAYQLAANEEVQDKLRDSIIAYGIKSDYLHWCINESLRIVPPVQIGCSRTISRDMVTRQGAVVPRGTIVVTATHSIHHSSDIWGADADDFKPERWRDSKNFHPVQYLAFGAGKRNCLGKEFALNSIKKLLVEMLTKYRFVPSPRTNAESILSFGSPGYIFLTSDTPTYINLRRV